MVKFCKTSQMLRPVAASSPAPTRGKARRSPGHDQRPQQRMPDLLAISIPW